jgi:hypothetical protein
MVSILYEIAGRRQCASIPVPSGNYDPNSQMWDTVAQSSTLEEGLGIFAKTNTPTTYSATTSTGKDKDSDDKGT